MSKPFAEVRRSALAVLLPALVLLGACSTAATVPTPAPGAAVSGDEVRTAYTQALAAMRQENWSAARPQLESMVASHPDLPGPAVNLGIVYSHLARPQDARKALEGSVMHFPAFAPGQHQFGLLLAAQGEFAAADAAYAQALAADPQYALAYYDRAVLNELYLQRPQMALQNYEAFQRLRSVPDKQVAGWIEDLRRRLAAAPSAGHDSGSGAHT